MTQLRSNLRPAHALVLLGAMLALLVGSRVSGGTVDHRLLVLGAAAGLALLAWHNIGAGLGVLVLAIENGLPGIDSAVTSAGPFGSLANAATIGVFALVVAERLVKPQKPHRPPWMPLLMAGGCLLLWWVTTLLINTDRSIPLGAAASFGRDTPLLLFSTVLGAIAITSRRELLGFVAVLVAGAVLFAAGQISITVLHHDLPGLVHSVAERDEGGVLRVYAFMTNVVALALPLSLAVAVFGSRRIRAVAAVLAFLFAGAVLAQLTRAIYGSLVAAIVLAFALFLLPKERLVQRARAMQWFPLAAVGLLLVMFVFTSGSSKLLSPVEQRLAGGVSEVQAGTGNVGYRLDLVSRLTRVLDGHELSGLGFQDPAYVYYPQLPRGSIRNSDVGATQILMTMGVIGIVLTYAFLLLVVAEAVRRILVPAGSELIDQVSLGLAAWLISVVLGSLTLSVLFSASGAVLVGIVSGAFAGYLRPLRPLENRASA